MNTEQLLKVVREKYLQFESYSDVGTASVVPFQDVPIEFKTYFCRPSQIRFEWRFWAPAIDNFSDAVVWWNGETAQSWFLEKEAKSDLGLDRQKRIISSADQEKPATTRTIQISGI